MAYTYGGNKKKSTTPAYASNFSNLQMDAARIGLTGVLGNFMQAKDATASPVYSPASNVSGSGAVLTVPQNAAQFFITPSVDTQVGADSTYAYGDLAKANVTTEYDCANQQYIYLKPTSGTNTTYFHFNCV